ncbi:MAG: B12-binding domain-containing radical SAM protein, partial [Dehalococcoidia bacterium]
MVRRRGPLAGNPDLQGTLVGNDGLVAPVFSVASALGPDPLGYLSGLVGGDERFFVGARQGEDRNYNYNDNMVLVEAIRSGRRGAFWDILRRL